MFAIVTAFHSEAKPLIEYFKLKLQTAKSAFPIYQNETMHLIISGMGKINAASAVGYLQAKLQIDEIVWLNFGIAGHRTMDLGSSIIAHKVIDSGTGQAFYPTITGSIPEKGSILYTVDQAERTFSEDYVYEMEASGFMQAALRFSSSELVHCYKIISDNLKTGICFEKQKLQKMIEVHLPKIQNFLDDLQSLRQEIPKNFPLPIEEFTSRYHFTSSEQHQLKRLLTRLKTINKDFNPFCELSCLATAAEVLYHLEQKINQYPLIF